MKLERLVAIFAIVAGVGCNCFAKDPSVAVLLSSDMEFYKEVSTGFKMYFADKGTAIKLNEYNLKAASPAEVAGKISSENTDLVFAIGEDALKTSKEMIKGPKIVFAMVFNANGIADENITGVLLDISPEMKLAGIKKILPNVKTIGMLYSAGSKQTYENIKNECEKRNITLNAKMVNEDAEFTNALNSAFSGSDCFLIILDPKIYFSQTLKFLLLESLKQKVPVIGLSSFYTKAGALASFDCDYKDLGRQSGDIAAKMLSGETSKPAHPRKYKYSLNLITANKIGIDISENVTKEAAETFDK